MIHKQILITYIDIRKIKNKESENKADNTAKNMEKNDAKIIKQ